MCPSYSNMNFLNFTFYEVPDNLKQENLDLKIMVDYHTMFLSYKTKFVYYLVGVIFLCLYVYFNKKSKASFDQKVRE